jgi:phosphoglycolate/pyridoxal phosphate phosphatase family enzyme
MRNRGMRVIFLSNNSTLSRTQYTAKLCGLGFAAHEHEVYCSSYLASRYLSVLGVHRVSVLGESGLCSELSVGGLSVSTEYGDLAVDALVVGLDYSFSYSKLAGASALLRASPHCLYIATNEDALLPADNDSFLPGAGSILAAVSVAAQRQPTVLGKPSPILAQLLRQDGLALDRGCLMVGDRIDTDMQFGRDAGFTTMLVLTGVAKEHDSRVDIVAQSLADIEYAVGRLDPRAAGMGTGALLDTLCDTSRDHGAPSH